MNRNRLLVLGVGATSLGVACLVACGDAEPGAGLVGHDDAGQRPDPSLPPESDAGGDVIADAGPDDADAEPSKPDADLSDRPVTCATTPCVTELVGGAAHFCARMSDGTIQCWGRNDRGSLGRGPDAGVSSARPAPVVGIASATQLTASPSSSATCARLADERVQCWGENINGQLGLTAPTVTRDSFEHHTPADLAIAASIARVAVGPLNGCAVASDGGDLYCWGSNANQALARTGLATSGTGMYYAPALAEGQGIELTPTAMGYRTSFGLTKDGHLVSWGMTSGRQSSLSHALPTEHATPMDVACVSSAGFQATEPVTCVVSRGRLYCWGKNRAGMLGTGLPDDELLPAEAVVEAEEDAFPQQVAVGSAHACARLTDGTVACSGLNNFGQAGAPADVRGNPTFRRVAVPGHAVKVATSANATCALLESGQVYCWGGNLNGERGQGTIDSAITARPDPVKVVFE